MKKIEQQPQSKAVKSRFMKIPLFKAPICGKQQQIHLFIYNLAQRWGGNKPTPRPETTPTVPCTKGTEDSRTQDDREKKTDKRYKGKEEP